MSFSAAGRPLCGTADSASVHAEGLGVNTAAEDTAATGSPNRGATANQRYAFTTGGAASASI